MLDVTRQAPVLAMQAAETTNLDEARQAPVLATTKVLDVARQAPVLATIKHCTPCISISQWTQLTLQFIDNQY